MTDLTWAPPPNAKAITVLPVGHHWDAVRTSTAIAHRAFDVLDDTEDCAAINDPRTDNVYWLIPPGEAARAPYSHWERLQEYVTILAAGPTRHYLGVPPTDCRTGPKPHWRIPAHWSGLYLARPYFLSAVLGPAVLMVHGMGALPLQCPVCDQPIRQADAVTALGSLHRGDPPRRFETHPTCARTAHLRIDRQALA